MEHGPPQRQKRYLPHLACATMTNDVAEVFSTSAALRSTCSKINTILEEEDVDEPIVRETLLGNSGLRALLSMRATHSNIHKGW